MVSPSKYIDYLSRCEVLRHDVVSEAIQSLKLPKGSNGLDAGCGIGLQTFMLTEAVGPTGRVIGLDISRELLEYAEQDSARRNYGERVTFRHGDIYALPFSENSFDWLWSADSAGYPTDRPIELVQGLAHVVKPGGTLALLIYSSQILLPGYPLLEARLNATAAGIAPFTGRMKPEDHFLGALGWFKKAGLYKPTARTFVTDVHAPLSDDIRSAMTALLDMRWMNVESELRQEDLDLYRRLCNPASRDFILNRPDYYAFFTYSLFQAQVSSGSSLE